MKTKYAWMGVLAGVLAIVVAAPHLRDARAQESRPVPAPALDENATASTETAVLAGGCFWGVQGVFQHVDGVTQAVSGYAGGDARTAVYDIVSSGATGHAESVKITFDPRRISYGKILQIYFSVAHDPTQRDRQGPDVGTQYRSAIFPADDEQAKIARAYIAQLDAAHVFDAAIATRIEPGKAFYAAEAYHQDYLTLHPDSPYIAHYDLPKIGELQKLFASLYKGTPVLVGMAATK
jgi:peptide-methionine (S)-S-oxide reductase